MRLLKRNLSGVFSLKLWDDTEVLPPYAILCHTWGPAADEVLFRDIQDGTAFAKKCYEKLAFCAARAANDGLEYFWVDTCCIDKSSSAELMTAINSMYSWYRNAKCCYVYMSDVTHHRRGPERWDPDFRSSRWFTRSWTLQELIAPDFVSFYSKEGKLLGDKSSLRHIIHEITRLPHGAMEGTPLSEFSVEERMLWAGGRRASLEQDCVYSLLGIFSVHMPIIYGEGRDSVMRRLRRVI